MEVIGYRAQIVSFVRICDAAIEKRVADIRIKGECLIVVSDRVLVITCTSVCPPSIDENRG